jgi:hypothetical protein
MYLYLNGTVESDAIGAYLNDRGDGSSFAVINLGSRATLHVHTPADADALIAAAVEAKRLLDPPVPAAPHPCCDHCIPGCDAEHDGHRIACTTPNCPSTLAAVTA